MILGDRFQLIDVMQNRGGQGYKIAAWLLFLKSRKPR